MGYGDDMSEAPHEPDERDLADHDPEEVLRRLLAISPKDAEKARDDAAAAAKPEADRRSE
jgi:hypothetical protein